MRSMTPYLCAFFLATPVLATDNCAEDAMIVFDGSGSMAESGFNQLDEPRIFQAREAVAEVLPDIEINRRLGLIVYGPGGADMCSGLDLRFAPTQSAASRIINAVNRLEPDGSTALTAAVEMAAQVLDYKARPATIVLVTDGKETCGGTPCQLAAELAADGLDITVHVIGFQVRGDYFSWQSQGETDYSEAETVSRCLADRTGGKYVGAETVEELVTAFRQTLGCNILF